MDAKKTKQLIKLLTDFAAELRTPVNIGDAEPGLADIVTEVARQAKRWESE